jgi:putative hydrolase of the HAD superfamily
MQLQLKSVIFDYGNVLCLPQEREDIEAIAAVFGAPVADFESSYWVHRQVFDSADITPDDYWGTVAADLKRPLAAGGLERVVELDNRSWAHPSPVMVRWASGLRAAGVRTAILSNMPVTLRAYLDAHALWMPAFDHRTFSCDVRLAKPGPEIFLSCLEGLGAAPGDTLFLDDREENVHAARSLGIHALCFTSPEQAQCEMNERYRLPVPLVARVNCDGLESPSPLFS